MNGTKHDLEKLQWDLLPFDAAELVVRVLEHGAKTYGHFNWRKGIAPDRLWNATMRHLVAMRDANGYINDCARDPESDLPHAAHAVCCLLFMLSLHQKKESADND